MWKALLFFNVETYFRKGLRRPDKQTRPRGYKTFSVLSSAEHEIFLADKYENTNFCWHFHIDKYRKFHNLLNKARKQLYLSVICCSFASKISCSAEVSMEKVS